MSARWEWTVFRGHLYSRDTCLGPGSGGTLALVPRVSPEQRFHCTGINCLLHWAGRDGPATNCILLYQATYMTQLPYIIMAIDAFIAGVLCLLLPETNKEPTAETLSSESPTALLKLDNDDEEENTEK